MSPPVPPEVEASYSAIIDSILAASDLSTISAKRIRKGLQAAVDYDITPQKDAITQLILARFDKANEQNSNGAASVPEPAPTAVPAAGPPSSAPMSNGISSKPHTQAMHADSASPQKRPASSDPQSASPSNASSPLSSAAPGSPDPTPPKKKHKKTNSMVDEDAEFARRLQAEENSRAARATRGGGANKKKPPVKREKTKKKKSAKKVDGEDDSELDEGSGKEVKRTGGFHKPMNLSPPLAELLGETQLSRPQCVKKIWDYVKQRDLQDPNDKRQIRCDEPMRAVFKSDRVHMFTMNKILNQNLYAPDE
ncbi:SWIB-domain-containing protein [Rhizodiscina lignyota]|uniref:SWIB-domain-containing protein n=1 Tax=Rhizodiscina lignyota TaxID=1504668 RepID=A0A9P4IBS1_9PEZI|nr:SWIB-domain-containing protein [Rhizodiscina lignyota]